MILITVDFSKFKEFFSLICKF